LGDIGSQQVGGDAISRAAPRASLTDWFDIWFNPVPSRRINNRENPYQR
jgi:hypothetical protein